MANIIDPATILHIAPTPFFSDRGCHVRIAGVVGCFQTLNFDNIVCTYHLGNEVKGIATHRIGNIKNYTKTSAGPSKYKLWADLKLLIVAVKEYRTKKPVAIHAHLHEGILIALLVKLLFFWRKTPVVADLQGSLVGELITYGSFDKYPVPKWPIALIERTLLFFSDRIVCSSQHSIDLMTEKFPESARKMSLAQDGADDPNPPNLEKRDALRQELGIDPEAICVVYSGVLQESKGLSELQELIRLTLQMSQNIHFLIIGYPKENIQAFLDAHNLASHCTLTGRLEFDALADYLALGDIAIDPKNSDAGEGSGKILNYMANSKAIVAFDTVNNQKFLGEDTRLARSVEEAHHILIEYAGDLTMTNAKGIKNYERFSENYSWSVCASQLERVYTQFLPSHFDKSQEPT